MLLTFNEHAPTAWPVKARFHLRSYEVVKVTIVPCDGGKSRDQNRVYYDFLDVRHRSIVQHCPRETLNVFSTHSDLSCDGATRWLYRFACGAGLWRDFSR